MIRQLIVGWRFPSPRFSLRLLTLFVIPTIAVLTVTLHSVALYTGLLKPPRPMYCNTYGTHEKGEWFPYWYPDLVIDDEQTCDCWVDYEDNAILVVMSQGNASAGPFQRMCPGTRSTEIRRGRNDLVALVKRKQNVAVIVRDDGECIEFPIDDEVAASFYAEHSQESGIPCPSLVEAVRSIVSEDDLFEFEEFVSLPLNGLPGDHPAAVIAIGSNTNSSAR